MTHHDSVDSRAEEMLPHFFKHCADTRKEPTFKELARYAIEYCARVQYKPRPKFPAEDRPGPGMLIYQSWQDQKYQRMHRNQGGLNE